MKRFSAYLLLALIVASCGTPSNRFRLEGRFRGFNQGELYFYAVDGRKGKMDTIAVRDGQFSYETYLDDSVTYSLVFPNYSEIPVFAEPGTRVTIEGTASHLKEIEVKGTDENEEMTAFRLQANQKTPPEVLAMAEDVIKEKPASNVSVYLLNKYFIQRPDPDYQKAAQLVVLIQQACPDDKRISDLAVKLSRLKSSNLKSKIPAFSAIDLKGRRISNADLNGDINVITLWASWNYESQNMQRQLLSLKKMYGSRLGLLSICLDANVYQGQSFIRRDSISWPNICDGKMWQTPLVVQLGLSQIPGNLIVDRSGTVVGGGLTGEALRLKLKDLLTK